MQDMFFFEAQVDGTAIATTRGGGGRRGLFCCW
jgi:hypothetical protein